MTTSLRQLCHRKIANTCLQCVHFSDHKLQKIGDIMTLKLRSTKQLLGRAGERFLLFGMLSHSKEGKLCLEDEDGPVELDFSQLVCASYFAHQR